MANEKNLIPTNKRSKSEAREISRKGGIASGKARRERKTLKELLLIALETKGESGQTRAEEIVAGIIDSASKGNQQAFQTIRDTIGEKPVEKINTELTGGITISWSKKKD